MLDAQCDSGTDIDDARLVEDCKAECQRRPRTCLAYSYATEEAPYCRLYARRSSNVGGECERQRRFDAVLFERVPGCSHVHVACANLSWIDHRYDNINTVVACGRARALASPANVSECTRLCAQSGDCQMLQWQLYAGDAATCTAYEYNHFYDQWNSDDSLKCLLQFNRRVNGTQTTPRRFLIKEKVCAEHAPDTNS